jgi:hypothetical protein
MKIRELWFRACGHLPGTQRYMYVLTHTNYTSMKPKDTPTCKWIGHVLYTIKKGESSFLSYMYMYPPQTCILNIVHV